MKDNNEKINQLLEKLDSLLKRQESFSNEINILKNEVNYLKDVEQTLDTNKAAAKEESPIIDTDFSLKDKIVALDPKIFPRQAKYNPTAHKISTFDKPPRKKTDLEKFIGENLINKIGIAITVIGVAIGAKYSIDNDLINPLTRIILGYLCGFGLLGFGIKLKNKYENYSAVLVSGAMAILYFITYAAYGFYGLIPQLLAFALMLLFTVFTVIAAINYNRQIIAIIGLVGAYAVPFLLSDGSGRVLILFSYMAIINIGILALAFKKYWKPLYYAAFALTWMIFLSWFVFQYKMSQHFALALVFLTIFFVLFYLCFLAYKLIRKEKFVGSDIVLLMTNSFIFYGMGYAILDENTIGVQLLGLFTLCNAVIYFIVSAIIYRQKLADKNIFYLTMGLVLIFITIAIPVQLDANWVSLLWAGEAALLFWIGRTKGISFYEKLSYPLMFLAFYSMLQDWEIAYYVYNIETPATKIVPIFNVYFLSSLLFSAVFAFINYLSHKKNYPSTVATNKLLVKLIAFSIPAILLIALYTTFKMEIALYWDQFFAASVIEVKAENQNNPTAYWNTDLLQFKSIWIINYTLFFVSILSFFTIKQYKKLSPLNFRIAEFSLVKFINIGLIILAILAFLTSGLYSLDMLRESYLEQTLSQYYHRGVFNLWIRYIAYLFVALTLYTLYLFVQQEGLDRFKKVFEFVVLITILWIASSELINWMEIFHSSQSDKLGLSILWGIYALFLIIYGIWKKNKPIRIAAMVLFGFTLIKLFFYDIAHLNTIAKTIVFVSLGVLLLIISFLYNKFKHSISSDEIKN